jgi:hypothetical protein
MRSENRTSEENENPISVEIGIVLDNLILTLFGTENLSSQIGFCWPRTINRDILADRTITLHVGILDFGSLDSHFFPFITFST